MIIGNLKLNETKVDEVLNVETLELEVRVLSLMLEDCKYKYFLEHQLNFCTPIDVTDDSFLNSFVKDYITIASNYKSVYSMIRLAQHNVKDLKENRNHVINNRGERMRIKETVLPDMNDPKVKNKMLYKQGALANLLVHAKHNFCRNQGMSEGKMVDVNNRDFLTYLFEQHAEHVIDMGGDLLYDKIDEYLAFMKR